MRLIIKNMEYIYEGTLSYTSLKLTLSYHNYNSLFSLFLSYAIQFPGGTHAMERYSHACSYYSYCSYRAIIQKEIVDCPTPKWFKWWIIRTAINNPNYNPTLPTAS